MDSVNSLTHRLTTLNAVSSKTRDDINLRPVTLEIVKQANCHKIIPLLSNNLGR